MIPRRIHRRLNIEELEPRIAPEAGSYGGQALYDIGPALISPAWFQTLDASPPRDVNGSPVSGGSDTGHIPNDSAPGNAASDEWIVQLSRQVLTAVTSVPEAVRLFTGTDFPLEVEGGLGMAGQFLVRTPGADAEAVGQWFRSNPAIAYYGPNETWTADVIPNDSSFSQLWGLNVMTR